MENEDAREITFGDPATTPRFVCPQIWTVQVNAGVNPAAILAHTPPHAIYVTAKLHPGMYTLVTNTEGSTGDQVDFDGVSGKIVGVQDTIDCFSRQKMIDHVLVGVEDYRRCRLGPFPRSWFIPDTVQNARAKLPLYPQSMWMKILTHYGEVEGAWLVQDGPTKLYLVALWESAESVRALVTDGLGRYVRVPKYSTARPLDVTIVEEDDKPITAPVKEDITIPETIQGVSTKGMSAMQYQAFQALERRVELLEKENAEMKELLFEMRKAEMMAKINAPDSTSRKPSQGARYQVPPMFSTAEEERTQSASSTADPPWKNKPTPSQRSYPFTTPIVPKAPNLETAPPPTEMNFANLPPPGGMHVGGIAAAGAAARAARRAAGGAFGDSAPWKRLRSTGGYQDDESQAAQGHTIYRPPSKASEREDEEKAEADEKINEYHNLLLGLAVGDK